MRPPPPTTAVAIGAACASLALAPGARAGPFEVFGFGPAGVAEAGARAARATDGTATFYNPGGLALGSGYSLELGSMIAVSALRAQGARQPIDDPLGGTLAFGSDVPFEGPLERRLRFGLGVYTPPTALLRITSHGASDPFYPYYDNRTQRLVVMPALGVRLAEWLGVGVGLNYLGGLRGPIDVRAGQTRALESRIDEEVPGVAAIQAGVRVDPSPRARIGLVWRQEFGAPIDTVTTADIGGTPLDVRVAQRRALYDPMALVLGASVDAGARTTAEIDAQLLRWSAWDGPLMDVQASVPGVYIPSPPQPAVWRDVVGVRAAGTREVRVSDRADLVVRLGAGFEPSVMKGSAQGRTNLLDGHKTIAGAGATIVVRGVVGERLRIGLGAQGQIVSSFRQVKRACAAAPCPADTVPGDDPQRPSTTISNPGWPVLEGGGSVWAFALGTGVDF